jgi:hypothetical protein
MGTKPKTIKNKNEQKKALIEMLRRVGNKRSQESRTLEREELSEWLTAVRHLN